MTVTTSASRRQAAQHPYLPIYLRDHRAGSAAGLSLARRFHEANRDDEALAATLAELTSEIEDERARLDQLMDDLDVRPGRLRQAFASVASRAGQLKLNGRFLRYSDLSRLEEFELLRAGILTKGSLWRSLEQVAATGAYPALVPTEMAEWARQADDQVVRLERHRSNIVERALVTPS